MLAEDNRIPGADKNDFIIHYTAENMSFTLAWVVFVPLVPPKKYSDRPRWLLSTQQFYIPAEDPEALVEHY